MNYYYTTDGQQIQGPVALEALTNLHRDGHLPPGTQVCPEGAQAWVPMNAVLGQPGVPPPPPGGMPPPVPMKGDETGGIIPYKNPQALIAYYLGIFGLIPLFGFFLAVPAFILGILGLRKKKKHPVIKGSVHAWIGIILGGLSIVGHLAVVGLIVANARH